MNTRPTRDDPGPGIKLRKLKRPMVRNGRKITEVFDVVVTLPRDERGRYPKKWSRGHATLKEALDARTSLQADKEAGRIVRPGKTSVEDYLRDWIGRIEPPATELKRSTWLSYESHARVHLIPRLGTVRLNRLTMADVRRVYSDMLRSGVAPATVRRIHATLHRALADAVEDRLLPMNPASVPHKKLPKAVKYDYATWDGRELRTFLAQVADDRLFAAFHVAAFTGLRRGELLALRWRDVDLDGRTVSVRRAMLSLHPRSRSRTRSPRTGPPRRPGCRHGRSSEGAPGRPGEGADRLRGSLAERGWSRLHAGGRLARSPRLVQQGVPSASEGRGTPRD
ncbi:MAG: site-specific integrase [Actinobacteria bacterium]|nr:site-specific integrase [Actinomycetota bacterium]